MGLLPLLPLPRKTYEHEQQVLSEGLKGKFINYHNVCSVGSAHEKNAV